MASRNDQLTPLDLSDLVQKIRARTPARLLAGRSGASYRTATQMELREAHADARDAVRIALDMQRDFGEAFIGKWNLFEVRTEAATKEEYLLRPDLGRRFSEESRELIRQRCSTHNQLQIVIGDGLSVTAVSSQATALAEHLLQGARDHGWTTGQSFVIRHCRVGILNEIGEMLQPQVAVLLIGERPGLATAESLSAYLAYKPDKTHTDANRNLISNIHPRGVSTEQAANRILNLAARMLSGKISGCQLREELPSLK